MITKVQKSIATKKLNIAPEKLPVRGRGAAAVPLGNSNAQSAYVYIRYASDASGTGFSDTPNSGLHYIAIKSSATRIVNPIASDFEGLWFNYKGDSGEGVNTVIPGIVDPTTEGNDGDHYINTATNTYFGPKAGGTWPAGVSMIGPQGPQGDPGDPGENGNTIIYGEGAPTEEDGTDGDTYIRTDTDFIYGPKASGVWPAGRSLIGPPGESGGAGVNGKTILYGTVAPTTEGVDDDFYINISTNMIYGPKVSDEWPAGVSLVGPTGPTGAKGDKAGYPLIFSNITNTGVNPGLPYFRFNNANSSGTTEIALHKVTTDGFDMTDLFGSWEVGGRLYFEQRDGNKRATFGITSIESNANHWEFGAAFLSGINFAPGDVVSINYYDSAETQIYDNLSDPDLPPASANPTLAVILSNISGNPTGKKAIAVSDGASTYDGVGRMVIEHDNETHALVFPNTGLTWTASEVGGFVRLTANAAHGLTSGVCDNKAKLHIGTASTGFGLYDLLPITSVVNTTVIQTSFPWPGGTPAAPLISDAGDTAQLKPTKIPALRNNSRIIVDANFIASGAGNKTAVAKLGGSDIFTPATITTAVNIHIPFEVYNKGVTGVQETRMGIASANGVGTGAAGAVLGIDTTSPVDLTFHFTSTVVNELIGIRSRLIEVIH